MINFKEEVEKRKEQLIQDIETLCAIPSVYNEKTIGENQPYGSECRQALDAMLAKRKFVLFLVVMKNVDLLALNITLLRIHIHLWDLLLMLNSLLFMVKKELFVSI